MNGTVKFFNAGKGFGFIAAEDGKEYFVHITGLAQGVNLNDNDAVSFDVEEGDRGPKAVNVRLGSEEEAPAAQEPAEEAAPADDESADDDSVAEDEDEQ